MMQDFKQAIVETVNRKIHSAREAMLNGGLDGKRPAAWGEFGFKVDIGFSDYFNAYDRNSLAFAAVDKRASKVWSDDPWVIEGEATDDDKKTSPLEASLVDMAKRSGLWAAMYKADEFRMVGGWSALILHIADGDRLEQPVTKTVNADSFVGCVPAYANQIKELTHKPDGSVETYQYHQPATGIAEAKMKTVHADRVVIIGDPLADRSLLRAGFNDLVNIEKVIGGSGESFLKNAARAIGINYDKDVDFSEIAKMYGKTPEQMHEVLNETARDLNMSIDVILATQGAQVQTLSVAVSDPQPTFNVAVQSFASSVDMPVKVLVGNVTGERASTEDLKQWNATCQSYRATKAAAAIRKLFERLIKLRLLPAFNFSVMWTDLRESSPTERATYAGLLADVNQKMAAAKQVASVMGDDMTISDDEIRTAIGYETIQEA